jgi:hypothetical protein
MNRGSLHGSAQRRQNVRRFRALLLSACLLAAPRLLAQPAGEYEVKAVVLWRLAQFVDWPTNTFDDPAAPIVVGVLGRNPFNSILETVVQGETAKGRPLRVEYYRRPEEIRHCHILFVSKSETRRIQSILALLRDRRILTVSDIDQFADEHHGIVGLRTEEQKVKLRINLRAAAAERLVLDPRLLRVAETVLTE